VFRIRVTFYGSEPDAIKQDVHPAPDPSYYKYCIYVSFFVIPQNWPPKYVKFQSPGGRRLKNESTAKKKERKQLY